MGNNPLVPASLCLISIIKKLSSELSKLLQATLFFWGGYCNCMRERCCVHWKNKTKGRWYPDQDVLSQSFIVVNEKSSHLSSLAILTMFFGNYCLRKKRDTQCSQLLKVRETLNWQMFFQFLCVWGNEKVWVYVASPICMLHLKYEQSKALPCHDPGHFDCVQLWFSEQ